MDNALKLIDKDRFQDFNIQETRGWVLERFLQVEHAIDKLILEYFAPNDPEKFRMLMLNGAQMDLGKKIKILRNISNIHESLINQMYKLVAFRNTFAHSAIGDFIHIKIDEILPTGETLLAHTKESTIEVFNSKGVMIKANIIDYLYDYNKVYQDVRVALEAVTLHEALGNK